MVEVEVVDITAITMKTITTIEVIQEMEVVEVNLNLPTQCNPTTTLCLIRESTQAKL